MTNFSNSPNPDGAGGALVVETKPQVIGEFLNSRAPKGLAGHPETEVLSWQARAALATGIQYLAAQEDPISSDISETVGGISVSARNEYGHVFIELAHPRSGPLGPENRLDLTNVPVFLLTMAEGSNRLVVHPNFFQGAQADFANIADEYQVLLSPHYGVVAIGAGGNSISNVVANGTSTDGSVSVRVTERDKGELKVSFSAQPQTHDPADPGSITVENRSVVFFAFIDDAGNKIDVSEGRDEERLGSQGSAELDDALAGKLTGICEKSFRNIPAGSRLVFAVSPL